MEDLEVTIIRIFKDVGRAFLRFKGPLFPNFPSIRFFNYLLANTFFRLIPLFFPRMRKRKFVDTKGKDIMQSRNQRGKPGSKQLQVRIKNLLPKLLQLPSFTNICHPEIVQFVQVIIRRGYWLLSVDQSKTQAFLFRLKTSSPRLLWLFYFTFNLNASAILR